MEITAERDVKFHRKLKGNLNAAGHPAETVPEHGKPVFGVTDVAEVIGNTAINPIEEALSGKEGLETGVRVTASSRLRRWVWDRLRRKQE